MTQDFSFPTEKVTKAAADVLSAASELNKIREKMQQTVAKASGAWECAAADQFLGQLRDYTDKTGNAPYLMALSVGSRLTTNVSNFTKTEAVAVEREGAVQKMFE